MHSHIKEKVFSYSTYMWKCVVGKSSSCMTKHTYSFALLFDNAQLLLLFEGEQRVCCGPRRGAGPGRLPIQAWQ